MSAFKKLPVGEKTDSKTTWQKFTDFLKDLVLVLVFIGVPAKATDYMFRNKFYTGLAVIFAAIGVYLLYLTFQLKELDRRIS